MGEKTNISWCDATFNPWIGCEKTSPACKNCYARTLVNRWGGDFDGVRRVTSDANWKLPLRWDRKAKAEGGRATVFCGSLMDVFEDRRELLTPRRRLIELIYKTPNLFWLLLTKRPENIRQMVPQSWLDRPRSNVAYGTTVESNDYRWRIGKLLRIPAALHFVSAEPMLGEINFDHWSDIGLECHYCGWLGIEDDAERVDDPPDDWWYRCPKCEEQTAHTPMDEWLGAERGLGWAIIGGESGSKARPTEDAWIRSLVAQCRGAGTLAFVKQRTHHGRKIPLGLWPQDLRIREVPSAI